MVSWEVSQKTRALLTLSEVILTKWLWSKSRIGRYPVNVRQIAPSQALEDLPLRLLFYRFPPRSFSGWNPGLDTSPPPFFCPGKPRLPSSSWEVTWSHRVFRGWHKSWISKNSSPFGTSKKSLWQVFRPMELCSTFSCEREYFMGERVVSWETTSWPWICTIVYVGNSGA